MKKRVAFCVVALSLALAGWASAQANPDPPAPTAAKVAIINIQRAIAESTEGKKAAEELTKRFTPMRTELQKMQDEIAGLQKKLETSSNVLNDQQRAELTRDIERKTKEFNRRNEDANTDFQQAEQQVINNIGQKVMQVIDEYARKRTYDVILDVSSPQSNVLWATNKLDITDEVIAQYNSSHPGEGAAPASGGAGAVKPAPRPATPAPGTTPATKPPVTRPQSPPPPRQ